MRHSLALLATVLLLLPSCATDESASSDPFRSADREAVLKALRTGKEASFKAHLVTISGDWAYADVTPLDKAGRPIAEGGPHVLHRGKAGWKDLDLAKVPADPKDPLGPEDSSPGWVRNVQRTYPGVPAKIFPKPSH